MFQYFNFDKKILKNEKLFQKLEFCFLVKSTKIKNATFPGQMFIAILFVSASILFENAFPCEYP